MPILRDWKISLSIDQVLRAQGVTPQAMERFARQRDVAAQALALGLALVEPAVAYRQFKVKAVHHERLVLSDGTGLTDEKPALLGKGIVRLLAPARQVVILACTIGGALENLAAAMLPANQALGLALDALGSAAVQALIEQACAYFGEQAAGRDWQATVPFSPGMPDWPVDHGQEQIFALLNGAEPLSDLAGIRLMLSGRMAPQKSISAAIGLGPEVDGSGRVCDYCSIRQTCRHQDQYIK